MNDAPDNGLLPDMLYLSEGSVVPVSTASNIVVNGTVDAGNLSVTVSASAPAGWTYLRFEDPGSGQYRLAHVRRTDNSEISLGTNVWTTDRIFRGGDLRPLRTNLVHILDYNTSGSYTLVYEVVPSNTDTNPPISAVTALASTSSPNFPVSWSGADDTTGSGLAFFSIYVSDDGGTFNPWVTK